MLKKIIRISRSMKGVEEVIIIGDFNRHDILWGGNSVTEVWQGEGQLIIELMAEMALQSLISCGIKTWYCGALVSTIDLILTSPRLTETLLICNIYLTEYGSDYSAVAISFNINNPRKESEKRLLFKNTPWNWINKRVKEALKKILRPAGMQIQADKLLGIVKETVELLTLKAHPSRYAKRW